MNKHFFVFVLLSLFLIRPGIAQNKIQSWSLNDVSILFPLPDSQMPVDDFSIKPDMLIKNGSLVPGDLYQKIPTLDDSGPGNETLYKTELRVVAIRLDPCPAEPSVVRCRPELRLVWQPVYRVSSSQDHVLWSTRDTAIHTFYRFEEYEFDQLMSKFWAVKSALAVQGVETESLALQIHPGFLSPRTRAKMLSEIKLIFAAHLKSEQIYKITFMRLLTPQVWWRFEGFVKENNVWKKVGIPRVDMTFEDIFNSAPEEEGLSETFGKKMDAIFNILPDSYPKEDDLTEVINHGFRQNSSVDRPTFMSSISAIERFQNPHFTNPHTLDCASCHFADSTRLYIDSQFSDLSQFTTPFSYQNSGQHNISNTTEKIRGTRVVRAFGYFGHEPAIMQRTINDSAESANVLNNMKK